MSYISIPALAGPDKYATSPSDQVSIMPVPTTPVKSVPSKYATAPSDQVSMLPVPTTPVKPAPAKYLFRSTHTAENGTLVSAGSQQRYPGGYIISFNESTGKYDVKIEFGNRTSGLTMMPIASFDNKWEAEMSIQRKTPITKPPSAPAISTLRPAAVRPHEQAPMTPTKPPMSTGKKLAVAGGLAAAAFLFMQG